MKSRPLPETLIGERIVLKRPAPEIPEIAEPLFQLIDSNRSQLGEFLFWPALILTVDDEMEAVKKFNENWNAKTCFAYAVFTETGSKLIGMCDLHSIDWKHQRAEFGYWLDSDHQGQGYIQEATRIIESNAFKVGFERLVIKMDTDNTASYNSARKAGFTHEGTLRQVSVTPRGRRDEHIFSKLKDEWEAAQ